MKNHKNHAQFTRPSPLNVAVPNFLYAIDEALKHALRVIAVLGPDYLQSQYAKTEWMEAFRRDPQGKDGLLLTIRVEPCDVTGLLGSRVYIDLVGTDEQTTRERLMKRVPCHWRTRPGEPDAGD